MSGLIPGKQGGLISLIHGKGGEAALPKPFEREIFLFETRVAGTTHVEGIMDLEPHLNIGDKLDFFREPENPHDAGAIVIRTAGGNKIGYVPQDDNVIFSRLMDAGKLLFARIYEKQKKGNWLKLDIKVYLND